MRWNRKMRKRATIHGIIKRDGRIGIRDIYNLRLKNQIDQMVREGHIHASAMTLTYRFGPDEAILMQQMMTAPRGSEIRLTRRPHSA